jgi:hypothetical protein
MKNGFIISEEEKQRILNSHVNATKNHYISEQTPNFINTGGSITSNQQIASDLGYGPRTQSSADQLASGGWTSQTQSQKVQNQEQKPLQTNSNKTTTTPSYVTQAQILLGMPANEQDGKFGPKTLAALQAKLGVATNTQIKQDNKSTVVNKDIPVTDNTSQTPTEDKTNSNNNIDSLNA